MMHSVDLDSRDVTFSDWKDVFSQIKSKCKYWVLNLGNKSTKTKKDFAQQREIPD